MGKALKKLSSFLFFTLILATVTILFSLASGVLMIRNIQGNSMSTTLHNGDKVLTVAAFDKVSIKRGDIITFKGRDKEHTSMIKRVIGLPNETVEIIDGNIYVDGSLLDEEYIHIKYTQNNELNSNMRLGNDEYFVMGDNRLVSMDSRTKEVGAVKRSDITGVYLFTITDLIK